MLEEVLDTISKAGGTGKNVTSIAIATGLLYQDCMRKCLELTELGLLRSWRDGRSLIFMITPKGLKTLSEIKGFLELARSQGLNCQV